MSYDLNGNLLDPEEIAEGLCAAIGTDGVLTADDVLSLSFGQEIMVNGEVYGQVLDSGIFRYLGTVDNPEVSVVTVHGVMRLTYIAGEFGMELISPVSVPVVEKIDVFSSDMYSIMAQCVVKRDLVLSHHQHGVTTEQKNRRLSANDGIPPRFTWSMIYGSEGLSSSLPVGPIHGVDGPFTAAGVFYHEDYQSNGCAFALVSTNPKAQAVQEVAPLQYDDVYGVSGRRVPVVHHTLAGELEPKLPDGVHLYKVTGSAMSNWTHDTYIPA